MKKLEIIIRPDRLEDLKQILNGYAVGGMTVFSVMGCGNQKGDVSELKGMKLVSMNLIPKIQANVVVDDDVDVGVFAEVVVNWVFFFKPQVIDRLCVWSAQPTSSGDDSYLPAD